MASEAFLKLLASLAPLLVDLLKAATSNLMSARGSDEASPSYTEEEIQAAVDKAIQDKVHNNDSSPDSAFSQIQQPLQDFGFSSDSARIIRSLRHIEDNQARLLRLMVDLQSSANETAAKLDKLLAGNTTSIENKIDRLLTAMVALQSSMEKLMALVDDLKAAIQKLDAETTAIGVTINALVAKLQSGSLSPSEQADVFAALTALSDRLTVLAVDPTIPVPPPTPAVSAAHALGKKK